MTGKLKEIICLAGGEWLVSFTTRVNPVNMFYRLQNAEVDVDIKKVSRRRTKTANDFCWAMCTDIGNALTPPIPKEEVYREAIKAVGKFETMHMRAEAVDMFREIWSQRGVGWQTAVIDYSDIPGCKIVFAYYGSSTYNTEEMSRLISYLKQDMENMELPIPISKEEEERLLAQWGKASCRTTEDATSAGG